MQLDSEQKGKKKILVRSENKNMRAPLRSSAESNINLCNKEMFAFINVWIY